MRNEPVPKDRLKKNFKPCTKKRKKMDTINVRKEPVTHRHAKRTNHTDRQTDRQRQRDRGRRGRKRHQNAIRALERQRSETKGYVCEYIYISDNVYIHMRIYIYII